MQKLPLRQPLDAQELLIPFQTYQTLNLELLKSEQSYSTSSISLMTLLVRLGRKNQTVPKAGERSTQAKLLQL